MHKVTVFIILKMAAAVAVSGLFILALSSLAGALRQPEYLKDKFGFDWAGMFVSLGGMAAALGILYLLVR